VKSRHEFWSFRHQLRRISRGKILRVVTAAKGTVSWSTDSGATTSRLEMAAEPLLGLWFADLPTERLPRDARIEFTILWDNGDRAEGRNWQVRVD